MLRYIIEDEWNEKISVFINSPALVTATGNSNTNTDKHTPQRQGLFGLDPIPFRVGHIRLMRRLQYKGQFFVPFIPTKHFLLIFPSASDEGARGRLSAGAGAAIACFLLDVLAGCPGGAACVVVDAGLCLHAGAALLVLRAPSVEAALAAVEGCGDVARQPPAVRTGPTYVQCHPCEPPPFPAEPGTGAAAYRAAHYLLPTCVLCAERLEGSLTGREAEAVVTCACGREGRPGCDCLAASRCAVCQMLYRSQTSPGARGTVKCEDCRQSGDPWICLICGYVGCSRYQAMHAKEHGLARQHFFSINLLTQQIWDYSEDAFVHQALMVFDFASGSTTRVRYPSREAPLFVEENDGKDPFWQKKSVSAKYDAKLRASHMQYATVIKNELDAMRQVYENEIGSSISNSQGGTPHSKRIAEGESAGNLASLAPSFASPWSNSPTESHFQRNQMAPLQKAFGKVHHSDPLAPMKTIHFIMRKVLDAQEIVLKSDFDLQKLSYDICLHNKESMQLEERVHDIEEEFRAVVQKNIASEIELDATIEETQTILKEIRLNIETERRLRSQLDDSDKADKMVIMGKGKRNM